MSNLKWMPIIRNLLRNRLYTVLNLSGLTIGMAAAMLIALWVQNELRFDRYHRRADNLWRVKTDLKISDTETWHWGQTPLKVLELCEQIPGIVSGTQLLQADHLKAVLRHGPETFLEEKMGYIGPRWFETFDYNFVEGSAAGFGDRPNDIILTESLAHKIFGDHSALGSVVRIDSMDYAVHAVLRDSRPESSFRQNILLPMEAFLRQSDNRKNDERWSNFNYITFLELRPDAKTDVIATQLTQALQTAKQDPKVSILLVPLADTHFDTSVEGDVFEKGSLQSIWSFGLIGLLVLVMAAINYVSLTTARAQTRAREVGIRKIVGASKASIFRQFLQESLLLAGLAALLALVVVHTALPWFSEVAGHTFQLDWKSPLPWLLTGGTLAGTVLLAGIYPALLLAGFQPMLALRGQGKKSGMRAFFRQSLVVLQFSISVALLICTIVIGRQRSFIEHTAMGYDRAQVFGFTVGFSDYYAQGKERGESMVKAIEQHLQQSSAIAAISRANDSPVHIKSTHSGSVKFNGLPEDATPTVAQLSADEHFADLFGLQLAEGRWFEKDKTSDVDNVILNETAARKLGLPQPWLGQRFGFHQHEGQVIGIVRDFHFLSLHEAITPLVIYNSEGWRGNFFVKTQPGQSVQALAAVAAVWKEWLPQRPFEYTFLDEDFDKMYRSEQRASLLFNLFAGITIFISCLGLFGLATFVAVQRTKEIGIRKVLGASVAGITGLLAGDFLKLVLIAIVVACPVAWYCMRQWLADFAYRVDLQWWMFALAGAAAVGISLLTVGVQSVKAALANPVQSLRSE